jgi:hypothetical protein
VTMEELAALKCSGTWDLIPLPPHVHPIRLLLAKGCIR